MSDTFENKIRIIFASIIGLLAIIFVLSSIQFVDAAPNLPNSNSKDAIEGWCNEHGGTFDTYQNGYSCMLPDGTFVYCERLDSQTTVCTKSNPTPTSNPNSPNTALTTLTLQSINIKKAQQEILTKLNSLATQVAALTSGQNALANQVNGLELACTTPDLLPMPAPGTTGPEGFCRRNFDGTLLLVQIYNQGGSDAPASTTAVTFKGPGNVLDAIFNLPTPALPAFGGSTELSINIPASCFDPITNKCNFAISADVSNGIAEADEPNNSVVGVCGSFLQ